MGRRRGESEESGAESKGRREVCARGSKASAADLVWFVINALDGRVFVCGSSKSMRKSAKATLMNVVMDKGGWNKQQAQEFWARKKAGGQYIAVCSVADPTRDAFTDIYDRRLGN